MYNQLLTITEGTFRGGLINGFARQLDAAGGCKLGFWKPIALTMPTDDGAAVGTSAADEYMKDATYSSKTSAPRLSVPWGKWVWYNSKSEQVCAEGHYIGRQDAQYKHKVQVVAIHQQEPDVSVGYLKNIEMSAPYTLAKETTGGCFCLCKKPVEKVFLE